MMLHTIVRRRFPARPLPPLRPKMPACALVALLSLGCAPRAWATDISSCPFTINSPGVYHVTQDLNCPNGGAAIEVNSDSVTLSLDGHTITGSGPMAVAGDAIDVIGDNCSVSGGNIQNFGFGVDLEGDGNSVSGLTITNCRFGVDVEGQSNTMSANSITGGDTGILVDGQTNEMTGNTFSNTSTGIDLEGNENTVTGNTVLSSQVGITADFGNSNTISDNTCNGGSTGIFLNAGDGNTVTGNTCNNNSTGIEVDASGNSMTGNTALGNSSVDLDDVSSTCDENVWSDNCFGTASHPCIGTSVCASPVAIACPQSRSVNAPFANPTSATVAVGMPTTAPAGLPVVGVRSDGLSLTDPFPLGTTTLTWMVNPGQDSAQTCMQTITVNPPGAPSITCPGNKTVTAATGQTSASVSVGMATTNATGATLVGARSDGKALTDPYPVGSTTITWMVTFDEQQPVTCTQTVTVEAAPAFPFIVNGPITANPHIDSIFVDRGPVYQKAIIHGSGFADVEGTSTVTLGGHQIPVLSWTNVAIGVLINPQAFNQAPLTLNAAYPVQVVIKANGLKSNTVDFFLTDGPPPD